MPLVIGIGALFVLGAAIVVGIHNNLSNSTNSISSANSISSGFGSQKKSLGMLEAMVLDPTKSRIKFTAIVIQKGIVIINSFIQPKDVINKEMLESISKGTKEMTTTICDTINDVQNSISYADKVEDGKQINNIMANDGASAPSIMETPAYEQKVQVEVFPKDNVQLPIITGIPAEQEQVPNIEVFPEEKLS